MTSLHGRRWDSLSPGLSLTRIGRGAPDGQDAVPKGSITTGQASFNARFQTASPREDGSGVPVGRVAVPKRSITTGQVSFNARFQTSSPRRDGSESPVGRAAVPNGSQKIASPRRDGSEVPVGQVAVPKDGEKNASPRRDAPGVPVGRVAVPKGTFLKGFFLTGIEPGYSCELAGVGFDVLLKQLADFLGGVGAIDPVVGDFRIADSSVDSPVGKFG